MPLTRWYLRHTQPEALAERLTGESSYAPALATVITDLRRGRVARRVAALLSAAASDRWREELRNKLAQYPGPLHVIVGQRDPLTPEGQALLDTLPHSFLTVIPGAGHHPQLTHPNEVARAIRRLTLPDGFSGVDDGALSADLG